MKDLGAATRADVLKTEVTHANNLLEELKTTRALELAKNALATYIGRSPQDLLEIVPEEPTLIDVLPLEESVAAAVERSPGLTAARAGRDASRSAVRRAKAARYPSLAAWASTDYFNFELSDFDDEHIEWRYGVSLDFTVFDGWLTKSEIRSAEAESYRAGRVAESQERDVIFAVRQAWFDTEIARRTIAVSEGGVRSSEEDLRLAEERYRLGEGTILDVIDAQVNLTRTSSALVAARYDARLAHSRLRSAIGSLALPGSPE
jgi:outer membrane protein TolC